MRNILVLMIVCGTLWLSGPVVASPTDSGTESIAVLIVDGQNNHGNWPETTEMMKAYLLETGKFTVDIARTAPKGIDTDYRPDFAKYDVVVSNYNGSPWPEPTKRAFVEFVNNGGGFVVIHAANNAFPKWREYNEIIGLGGWGGRNQDSGPYVYFNKDGKSVRDTSKGRGGNHGPQHEFTLVKRDPDHPIMKDVPGEWLHMKDELYDKLRGPAMNMNILATSFSAKKFRGTGRHEPMLMTLSYGKGRIFHTPMGHGNYSQECVGFITLFQRGTQWAATGKVDIPVPDDFPTATKTSSRKFTAPVQEADAEKSASTPDKQGFKKDVAAVLAFAEKNEVRNLIEQLIVPSAKDLFLGSEADKNIAEFKERKLPRLVKLLQSLDVDAMKFEGNKASADFGGRAMRFEHIDGHWRLFNN